MSKLLRLADGTRYSTESYIAGDGLEHVRIVFAPEAPVGDKMEIARRDAIDTKPRTVPSLPRGWREKLAPFGTLYRLNEHHWQLRGDDVLVNWWPASKAPKFQINGGKAVKGGFKALVAALQDMSALSEREVSHEQ